MGQNSDGIQRKQSLCPYSFIDGYFSFKGEGMKMLQSHPWCGTSRPPISQAYFLPGSLGRCSTAHGMYVKSTPRQGSPWEEGWRDGQPLPISCFLSYKSCDFRGAVTWTTARGLRMLGSYVTFAIAPGETWRQG